MDLFRYAHEGTRRDGIRITLDILDVCVFMEDCILPQGVPATHTHWWFIFKPSIRIRHVSAVSTVAFDWTDYETMTRDSSQSASADPTLRFVGLSWVGGVPEVLGNTKFLGCLRANQNVRWKVYCGISDAKLVTPANDLKAKYLDNVQPVGIGMMFDLINALYGYLSG